MRFAALVVVGDGNGHVGAGVGKASEVPEAIRKGKEDAMKHLVEVPIDENGSVPHDYIGKFMNRHVEFFNRINIKVCGRLVKNNNRPAFVDCPCNGNSLCLPA